MAISRVLAAFGRSLAASQSNAPLNAGPKPDPSNGGGPQYRPSDAVSGALIGSSLVSVLSLAVVVFSFLRWRRLRRHPAGLIAMRSILDLLFCIELVTSHLYYHNADASPVDGEDCGGFTFVTQFLAIGSEIYGALLSVDLFVSLTNPFTNFKKNSRAFHVAALAVALALSLPVLLGRERGHPLYGRDNYLAICWLRTHAQDGTIDWEFYSLFAVPLAGMYVFALLVLAFAQRRLRQGLPETFEARASMFRSSFRFVLSYFVYWALAGAISVGIHLLSDEAPPEALDLVLAFALGSRGIVTCAVWLSTYGRELRLSKYGLTMPPKPGQRGAGGDAGGAGADRGRGTSFSGRMKAAAMEFGFTDEDADLRPLLTNALRKEILYYTSLGIARGALHAMRDKSSDEVRRDGIALNRFNLSRQWEERGLFSIPGKKGRGGMTRNESADPSWFTTVYSGLVTAVGLETPAWAKGQGAGAGRGGGLQDKLLDGQGDPLDSASSLPSLRGGPVVLERNPSMRLLERAAVAEGVHIAVGVGGGMQSIGMDMDMPSPTAIPKTATLPGSLADAAEQAERSERPKLSLARARAGAAGAGVRGGDRGDRSDRGNASALNRSPSESPSQSMGNIGDIRAGSARDGASGRHSGRQDDDSRGATRHIARLLRAFLSRSHSQEALHTYTGMEGGGAGLSINGTPPVDRPGHASAGSGSSSSEQDDAGSAFQFVDYEPHLFARLREICGIDQLDYVRSLSRTSRERFSEGASGAFLYFSACEAYIVKTLSQEEGDVLLAMLHDYVVYMERHPHSLITRFYGLHSITMYGNTMFFVVMQNVLHPAGGATIHERYDLKGSWVNRHSVPLERGQKATCRYCGLKFKVGTRRSESTQCPARPNHPHEASTVLRDADWNYRLRLDQDTAQALGDMIVTDSEFLRRHGIMDYSLLLGIHRTKYKLVDVAGGGGSAGAWAGMEAGAGGGVAQEEGSGHMASDPKNCSGTSGLPGLTRVPSVLASPVHSTPSNTPGWSAMVGKAGTGAHAGPVQLQPYETTPLLRAGGSHNDVPSMDVRTDSLGRGGGSAAGQMGQYGQADGNGGYMPLPSPLLLGGAGSSSLGISPPLGGQAGQWQAGGGAGGAGAGVGGPKPGPIQLRLDLESGRQRTAITPFFCEHRGGLRAIVVEGPGVYYMGIIDVLQRYTWSKWIERQFKTLMLCLSPEGVSTAPPDSYARRFRSRVIAQLVEGYEWKEEYQQDETHHHAWEEDDFDAQYIP